MKILILGSDGQIGRPLVNYLKNLNHSIVEFDIFSDAEKDLRIPNILNDILPSIDFVFFLAFDVGGSIYLKTYQDSFDFISNNIKIMNNTFDSLKKYNTPFIFASSQMSQLANSSYGILKNIGEKYTNTLKNGKILKFWNVYGVEHDPKKFHVISDFIKMAKEQNIIKLQTNGIESRQFLYVDDCCNCLNIIMSNFSEINEKQFDVSSFEWITISEIAKLISNEFENCKIILGNNIDDVQRNSLINPNKNILKYWNPKVSIKDGINNIIKLTK